MRGRPILTVEDKLDAIGDVERRQILLDLHLQDDGEISPIDVSELLTNRKMDALKLFHTNLPKLNGYGLIDWDKGAGEISIGPDFEKISPLLTLLYEHQDELSMDWFELEGTD